MATGPLLASGLPTTHRQTRPDFYPALGNVPSRAVVPAAGTIEGVTSGPWAPPSMMLQAVAAEIEAFVGSAGWDRRPTLFALVPTRALAGDPAAVRFLGEDGAEPETIADSAITPIAQEDLPDGPLDETLAQIAWPSAVVGCALSQEIMLLPPQAEGGLDTEPTLATVAEHPERREARLVVAVLRNGHSAGLLRLRSGNGRDDDLLTGATLAPNLVRALAETLAE